MKNVVIALALIAVAFLLGRRSMKPEIVKIHRTDTVVVRDTVDADFAAHRQRFLAEQGYSYTIVDADAQESPAEETANGI